MSDNVKTIWAHPERAEGESGVPKASDVGKERQVVSRAFPNVSSLDRRILFLFEMKGSSFWRVNFHDPENNNSLPRSHFVEVRGGKAEEWPNPEPKPRGFDYDNLG